MNFFSLRWMFLWMLAGFQPASVQGFSLLAYNVSGNGTTDWSTNAPQVQAIGRQMLYLQPDIIAFNEIPLTNTFQMPNFVKAYLPGYSLATNSGTDGYLRSVIASRFLVVRSQKWLDGASLSSFGYNGTFTSDLFEAEINVPDYTRPVHIFTTHLKSGLDANSMARRAAEASAISNFFVNTFLPANGGHLFVLTGDLNEDVNRPPLGSQHPIVRLANSATGLHLTTPVNRTTGNDRTWSIRTGLTLRYDYILPAAILFSNIVSSDVFRTDALNPLPSSLEKYDDKTASDHLPVLMVFQNPDEAAFEISSVRWQDPEFVLSWQSAISRRYRVESSTNLTAWQIVATGLVAAGWQVNWNTPMVGAKQFFRVYREP